MSTLALVLVTVVALEHLGFMVLEMFFWTKPAGLKIFRQKREAAEASKVLAANQGLYNGFLAAGLIWSLILGADGRAIALFFLGCVVVAGIFGAATVNRRIFFVQGLPALIAMGVLLST
jgi:putative membrane protein